MKKVLITLLVALGVALTTTEVNASVSLPKYNDSTAYNRYGNVAGLDVSGRVYNRSTDGAILTYIDNFRVYNFVKEVKDPKDGTAMRYWQPKSEVSVITNPESHSYDNDGAVVYNFDEYGNQLMEETTDFYSLDYLGHLNINGNTVYRYWK